MHDDCSDYCCRYLHNARSAVRQELALVDITAGTLRAVRIDWVHRVNGINRVDWIDGVHGIDWVKCLQDSRHTVLSTPGWQQSKRL